jgi:hypothetical protein
MSEAAIEAVRTSRPTSFTVQHQRSSDMQSRESYTDELAQPVYTNGPMESMPREAVTYRSSNQGIPSHMNMHNLMRSSSSNPELQGIPSHMNMHGLSRSRSSNPESYGQPNFLSSPVQTVQYCNTEPRLVPRHQLRDGLPYKNDPPQRPGGQPRVPFSDSPNPTTEYATGQGGERHLRRGQTYAGQGVDDQSFNGQGVGSQSFGGSAGGMRGGGLVSMSMPWRLNGPVDCLNKNVYRDSGANPGPSELYNAGASPPSHFVEQFSASPHYTSSMDERGLSRSSMVHPPSTIMPKRATLLSRLQQIQNTTSSGPPHLHRHSTSTYSLPHSGDNGSASLQQLKPPRMSLPNIEVVEDISRVSNIAISAVLDVANVVKTPIAQSRTKQTSPFSSAILPLVEEPSTAQLPRLSTINRSTSYAQYEALSAGASLNLENLMALQEATVPQTTTARGQVPFTSVMRRMTGPRSTFNPSGQSQVGQSVAGETLVSSASMRTDLESYVPEYERSSSMRVANKSAVQSKWKIAVSKISSCTSLPCSPFMPPEPISRQQSIRGFSVTQLGSDEAANKTTSLPLLRQMSSRLSISASIIPAASMIPPVDEDLVGSVAMTGKQRCLLWIRYKIHTHLI